MSNPFSSRGSRQSSHSSRQASRGGIQKRTATPTRLDKDGDLMMDATGANGRSSRSGSGRGGANRGASSSHRTSTPEPLSSRISEKPGRTGLDPTAIQKAVLRGMGSNEAPPKGRRGGVRDATKTRDLDRNRRDGLDQVRIVGLKRSKAATNPDGGVSDLVAFIERKATNSDAPAREAVKIRKSHMQGDALIISVKPEDTAKILRLNRFTFASAQLLIEDISASSSQATKHQEPETPNTIDLLKAFLSRRYEPQSKFLDLSQMGSDTELVSSGMFNTTSRESKFFPALMKVCDTTFSSQQEKDEAIISVSLASNTLSDISSVTTLSQTFPVIQNLDLSNNHLNNLKSLDGWRWKFRKLEHIILSGNPIEKNEPNYGEDLLKWFPSLTTLNSVQIRSKEEAQAANSVRLPLPTLSSHFKDEMSIGENFVKQFFLGFDTNRPKLAETYYDHRSTFSLSVNTSAPRLDPEKTQSHPTSWDSYIKRSRNLTKITQPSARMSRLYTGVSNIKECFATLPATRHPDLNSESSKWCIECHAVPGLPDVAGQSSAGVGGLIVTAHGEYSEINVSNNTSTGTRSFDRTMVLGAGGGALGITILSDTLVLRAYGGYGAWQPDQPSANIVPPPVPAANGHSSGSNVGVVLGPADRDNKALELSKATGMTPEYCVMCLEQSDWNLEGALLTFENAKANLPPEAFLRPVA